MRTIRGLISLFTVTVILGRVYNFLIWVLIFYARNSKPLFVSMLNVFIPVSDTLIAITFFMNNILNIFIYAKMIPAFRRFLWTVLTFGMHGRRNVP